MTRGVTQIDDDAWFPGAAVSDLERRDRDVDGETIGNERTAGCAEITFGSEEFVDNCWACSSRTVILGRLYRWSKGGITHWPAKLEEITNRLVRIIAKTAAPFGNVEVR